MTRITDRDNGNPYIKKCFEGDGYPDMSTSKCDLCEHFLAVFEKLAAYEDAGLTPDRAAELAAADRDKRLAVLPC